MLIIRGSKEWLARAAAAPGVLQPILKGCTPTPAGVSIQGEV